MMMDFRPLFYSFFRRPAEKKGLPRLTKTTYQKIHFAHTDIRHPLRNSYAADRTKGVQPPKNTPRNCSGNKNERGDFYRKQPGKVPTALSIQPIRIIVTVFTPSVNPFAGV
jgi:hypothetical protein